MIIHFLFFHNFYFIFSLNINLLLLNYGIDIFLNENIIIKNPSFMEAITEYRKMKSAKRSLNVFIQKLNLSINYL